MKRNKIILFILGILAIFTEKVFAQTYSDSFIEVSKYVPNAYISKKNGSTVKYQQLSVITRKSNGQFVYCIEPLIKIKEGLVVIGQDYDQDVVANMSLEEWRRVNLLAYYGYMYGNHMDLKWYAVTQLLIWQTVEHNWDIYFTDKLNGKKIDKYTDEINELNSLVENHHKMPSFIGNLGKVGVNTSIDLVDENNVLSNYKITNKTNINASINDNKLNIVANSIGESNITLEKRDTNLSHPTIIFYNPNSQNVIERGSYDPIQAQINLTVVGGKISIKKIDYGTNSDIHQGDASLDGAIYGIYKEDGTKLGTISTKEKEYVSYDGVLELGKYYIQEEQSSNGYELDGDKHYFEINTDNLEISMNLKEKVIEKEFKIFKVLDSGETEILTPEPNVKFDIYLKSTNQKINSITTDKNGFVSIKLPYGTYIVKQVNTTANYAKVKDFEITIDENVNDDIVQHLTDRILRAKLKVIKIDKDTNEVIKRSNIKFKIYNLDKNEYVCQTTDKTICEYSTNNDGFFITALPLLAGTYRLEEVNQPIDGYLWNSQSKEFSINENSELIDDDKYGIIFEVKFENKSVKGILEITKQGEDLKLENSGYVYNKINLSKVKFGLYANQDFYELNGSLKYKKNQLVKELVTDENGYAKIDNLDLGKYYIKELSTVNNHILDENEYDFELKYIDQYTKLVSYKITLENHLPKGTLEFTKTDFSTSETLPNTKIEVFTEKDELVFQGTTDENGKVIISELPLGRYYIMETEAPSGYILNQEKMYFEITKDGEVVKSTMTNQKDIIEVPDTLKNNYIVLIATIIMAGTTGFIIYEKFNNKHKKK